MPGSIAILVIDDEENLRRTLAMILEREGYDVCMAGNVAEGRQYLQSGDFNLVFLDLKLPDADGLTLLPEIRTMQPNTPVLILTAHDKLEVAIEAVTHGARDYMLKPVDPLLLIERVRQVLAEK